MPNVRTPNDRRHRPEKQEIDLHVHMYKDGGTADSAILNQILSAIGVLQTQGTQMAADITLAKEALATLNTTTNELAAAVDSVIVADAAEDAAFLAEIQSLKDQIAAGSAVTQADLDELTAGMGATTATLTAVKSALAAMGASATEPIPPVDIPPVTDPNA